MLHVLFAEEGQPARGLVGVLRESWPVLLPVVFAFVAVYLLLPRVQRSHTALGLMAAGLAILLSCFTIFHAAGPWQEVFLFYAFGGLAVVSAGLMITHHNPVYSALSFAMVVLSTCGLFLLNGAPFLSAATIIIYAGAIVVTFLFVIMLAQQEGFTDADLRSREPLLASLAGFVLIASVLCVLQRGFVADPELDQMIRESIAEAETLARARSLQEANAVLGEPKEVRRTPKVIESMDERLAGQTPAGDSHPDVNALMEHWSRGDLPGIQKSSAKIAAALRAKRASHGVLPQTTPVGKPNTPGVVPAANLRALGQTLFTDYLIPVELAAVLLLVATIGAIAIAGRHSEDLR